MTISPRAVDHGAALGRESLERAQEALAEVSERLAEAAADAPRVVDSIGSSAREAASDLPDDLRDLVPPSWTSRTGIGISPVQGLLVIGVVVVIMAVTAAFVRRSRRSSARRRRAASKKST